MLKKLSRKANKRRELEGNWGGHRRRALCAWTISNALVFKDCLNKSVQHPPQPSKSVLHLAAPLHNQNLE